MTPKPLKSIIFGVIMLLLLNGCGFHLRGINRANLGINNVGILLEKSDREWVSLLKNNLHNAHVHVVEEPHQAEYLIIIRNEYTESNIVSISSSSSPRQYELTYHVAFSLQDHKGRPLIPFTTMSISRPITINNDRILGSHDEENQLKYAIRRDAATQLIYRISSWHERQRADHLTKADT